MVEERLLLLSDVPALHGYSAEESTAKLTPFRNEVDEPSLRDFFGYDVKPRERSYVERTIMSISTLQT